MYGRIKAFIKNNRWIYTIYFRLGSLLLQMLGFFIKTDPNLILFISYGGQKYDDSPKVVYEYLQKKSDFSEYKFVWAFIDPERFPQVPNKIKVDTIAYYLTALRAGIWITNSSASRGLKFKKAQTKNYLFQHGMCGIKKLGTDIQDTEKSFFIGFKEKFDAIFIEGKREIPILMHAWGEEAETFCITGLPRNDDLAQITVDEICVIKEKLNIPMEKKVILYAPTFREFNRADDGRNALRIPINFNKWEAALGAEYVMLITAHYEVAKLLDELPQNSFVINAFKYPELNDLIKVSDILISDYSSIVFDYSIMERPIFCYGYDYDTYAVERGFYTDLDDLFSKGVLRTEDALLDAIINIDYTKECTYTKRCIKEEYIAAYGDATEKAVQVILGEFNNSKEDLFSIHSVIQRNDEER